MKRDRRKLLLPLVLMFCTTMQGLAQKVTMNVQNVSVKQAISRFQKLTGYSFVFYAADVDLKNKVSVKATNAPIASVVGQILRGQDNISYQVDDSRRVIVKQRMNAESPSSQVPTGMNRSVKGKVIKGMVQDKNHEPIVGATVVPVGTTEGVATNADGLFTITLPDGVDKLAISYIGYSRVEVDAREKSNVNVTLFEDAVSLQDVVVVGYNTVKRGQITGAIDMVKGEKIAHLASAGLEDRLQGKISGLLISSGSGQPGSDDVKIRVRGTGSINGSNVPLYILDGVMIEAAQFASLNNDDILDVQVLKDASATAIYGSRGANGVIVVTTKKGMEGATQVSYNVKVGAAFLRSPKTRMMTGAENIEYQGYCVAQSPNSKSFPLMHLLGLEQKQKAGVITAAELQELNEGAGRLSAARSTDTDWIGEMTHTGLLVDHSITLSGGTEKTRFFVSGSMLDQQGSLKGSELKRYSARVNLDHKINRMVEFGLNGSVGYTDSHFADPNTGDGRIGWVNPWFTSLLAYPYENPDNWFNGDNPTLITKYFKRQNGLLRLIGSAHLQVAFTDWLKFKTNFGIDYYNRKNMMSLDRNHPKSVSNKGYLDQRVSDTRRYTWTNTLNFNKVFRELHSVSAVAGFELFDGTYSGFNQRGFDLDQFMTDTPAGIGDKNGTSKNPPTIGGGKTHSNLLSVFTQWNYTYNERYNLSASLRYDESSKFIGSNKGAVFWSVGAAWDMANEPFMGSLRRYVNQLKVRTSYGTTGNQDGIADFSSFDGYSKVSYNGKPGYANNELGNPELKWETSAQFDFGVDLRMFDNRFNATIDYYHKSTKDLLMWKKISQLSGSTQIQTNAGSILNQGVEIGVNGIPVRTKDFEWSVGANFTYNKNEIIDLGTWANAENKFVDGDYVYEVGRPLGTWCMAEWAGVNPKTGEAWFYDQKGGKTEDIAAAPAVAKFKSSEIPLFGGFNTNISYKGFSLMANFTYALNYCIMNSSRWYLDNHNFNGNKPAYMLTMWKQEGDITSVPRFDAKNNPSPWASQFLEDASYLKLKTLRLSYTPSRDLMNMLRFVKSATVYVQGENLATFTSYRGQDPEVSGDTDYMAYPLPVNVTFGLSLNF